MATVLGDGGENFVGVIGSSRTQTGVIGDSDSGKGVHGQSDTSIGVHGECVHVGIGVQGTSIDGPGVVGRGPVGVVGTGPVAGRFEGPVIVTGRLRKLGGGFHVDHPNDPANKYLNHSFVESSEMKNVYDGVAQLDQDGAASVDLPAWFEALNGDFHYQLTAVGQAAPNLHVAEEISENRFKIAGGEGGMKVCWQLTGTRKDPWAAANPLEVEEEKPQEERGRYLQPSLYGASEEQSVMRAHMGEMREPPQPPQPPQIELPGAPPLPPDFAAPGFDVVRLQQQLDELRGQLEEQRRGRMEDEIDELRRQIKKLRRRRRKR
jgi:hypothetical protein